MASRKASHAGSWYSSSGKDLGDQLANWLIKPSVVNGKAVAIISPHAGYAYCGNCAGYCYKQLENAKNVKRVFILGPSHHVALPGCAVTKTKSYETPLYNLTVDRKVTEELLATGSFDEMSIQTDEDEHSIEMQLPYIAKAMESSHGNFTVVPILVGSTSGQQERHYGKLLSKYLLDPENFFVISSDFCHWGRRFRYQHYDKECGQIYESIEVLDKKGMDHIENLNVDGFHTYLKEYSNTICGRHPIGIFLNIVRSCQEDQSIGPCNFKFLNYAQSNQCKSKDETSVSYAAGVLTLQ